MTKAPLSTSEPARPEDIDWSKAELRVVDPPLGECQSASMFTVGGRYNFVRVDHDSHTSWTGTVRAIDGPLLQVDRAGQTKIINTHSHAFYSATPQPRRGDEDDWSEFLPQS